MWPSSSEVDISTEEMHQEQDYSGLGEGFGHMGSGNTAVRQQATKHGCEMAGYMMASSDSEAGASLLACILLPDPPWATKAGPQTLPAF